MVQPGHRGTLPGEEPTAALADVVAASDAVAATRSRSAKVAVMAAVLERLDGEDLRLATTYLAGRTRQARLDVGWAALRDVAAAPAEHPTLALRDVDVALEALATAGGSGSRARRAAVLADVLGRATAAEQRFLRGLVLGDLRQGALEGIVVQAIAAAFACPEPAVRRAVMLQGDLGDVVDAARGGGVDALGAFRLELFRPVLPMLAATSASVADVVAEMGSAAVEWKLDGARVQVHRRGSEVRVFTRSLRDVTGRSPAVVEAACALPVRAVVLDGEVLVVGPDGRPRPFQESMSGFSRERAGGPPGLRPFFFDVLHLDGEDLLDAPLSRRAEALGAAVPAHLRVRRVVVDDPAVGESVLADALAAGHEGVVVKALDAPYEAGRRGASWRKVKPAHTFDLVVLAVEWGSGRRRGLLSNLHLGARDADGGGFVMLGKTFKGLTDKLLRWQTERFLELEVRREGGVVHVRPEQVVEVAIDGVQRSRRYPGGIALRFARVRRYRDDKPASEADTLDAVRSLLP